MLISIITSTYNSSSTITNTLTSIATQSYTEIEHLIIDGVSTDNTLNLINHIPFQNRIIISEPDKGIYDALNKGIQLAKGDVIGILHSDDFYPSNDVLDAIAEVFEQNDVDAVYGNLEFVSRNDIEKTVRYWESSKFKLGSFSKGWHPPHPTLFIKKSIYDQFGLFDTQLAVSADFELMLRFFEKHQIKTFYLDKTLVKMRYGGESTKSLKNIIRGNENIIKAFKLNGIEVSPFYTFNRLFSKLMQFVIR